MLVLEDLWVRDRSLVIGIVFVFVVVGRIGAWVMGWIWRVSSYQDHMLQS